MSRNVYIAVTQQVLLLGAETWVLTVRMEAALDAFQGRVFDRVGLQTNVDKTVIMACQPCRAGSGNRTAEGYRR